MSTTTTKTKTPGGFKLFKAALGIRPLSVDEEMALQAKKLSEATEKQRKEQEKVEKARAKAAKAEQKLKLKQTEAEAHYQRLDDQAREAGDALSGLRGAAGHLKLIEQGRQTAKGFADQGKFAEARAVLEKLDAPGLRDKGLKAEEEAQKKARESFPAVIEFGQKIKNGLGGLPISKDEAERISGEVDRLLAPLNTPGADSDIAETIKERLDYVQEHVNELRNEGEIARQRFIAALATAAPTVTAMAGVAADPELAPFLRDLAMARQWSQQKEYLRAAELAEGVVTRADEVKQKAVAAMAQWQQLEESLPQLIDTAKDLAADTSPVLVGREPTAATILEKLRTLEEQVTADRQAINAAIASNKKPDLTKLVIGSKLPFSEAVATVDQAEMQLTALSSLLTSANEMREARDKALSDVGQKINEVRQSLAGMRQAIAETVGQQNAKDSDGSFGEQLEAVRLAWETTSARAATPQELDAAGTLAKLDKLMNEIDAVTAEPALQHDMYLDQLYQETRDAFDVAHKACSEALARLFLLSVDDATRLQGQMDASVAVVEKAERRSVIVPETARVTKLTDKINEIAGLIAQNIESQRAAAQARLEEVQREIEGFEKDIEDVREKQKHNPLKNDAALYTPQFEALRDQSEQLESVVPIADMGGLNDAFAELGILLTGVKAARAALKGGRDSDGETVVTLTSLTKDLATLRGKLDRKDFRTYIGVTQAKLIDKAEDLKEKLPTMLIPAAAAKLDELETAYGEAKALLEKTQSAFEEFQKSVAQGRKMLAEQKAAFRSAPDAYAALEGRIRGCEDAAGVEGELEAARKKLLDILVELQDVAKDPTKIAAAQTEADTARKKAEENAARFKGQYESFLKRLESYTEIQDKDRKDIKTLAEGANKAFGRSADYDTAMVQLQAAAQRAELLHKYPEGAAMAARNNLPKVVARWKTAADGFGKSLAVLADKIEKIEDRDEYKAAKEQAAKMIKQLQPMFSPTAFDAAVAKMTAKGAPDTARAAAREDGLRMVRRYNAYLEKDYRFMELADNPFEPGLKSDIVAAHLALLDVERNLLISL